MPETTIAATAREVLHLLRSSADLSVRPGQLENACARLAAEVQKSASLPRKPEFNRILVAIDASLPAVRAIETANSMANDISAALAVVHVIDASPVPITESPDVSSRGFAAIERESMELCHRLLAKIDRPNVEFFLRRGSPPMEIIQAASDWKAKLIIMGSHGRSRPGKFFLGTTVEAVLRESPCPVMAVGDTAH